MQALFRLALVALAALSLAACGGDGDEESEAASEGGRGTITCEGSALSGDSGLPQGFPQLGETTYVAAEDRGPTRVVDGFATDELEGVYREMKERLIEEEYTILFDELEEDDSEISYRTPDGETEGIVALRAACDNGNVSVHITARPAG